MTDTILTIGPEDLLDDIIIQPSDTDGAMVITPADVDAANEVITVDAPRDDDDPNTSLKAEATVDDNVFAHFDEKDPDGEFGKQQVDNLKEFLNISRVDWSVKLVVDVSQSQTREIKERVTQLLVSKVILALGYGMKQEEIPVFTFADHFKNLDPITAENAGYYAGKSTNDKSLEELKPGNKLRRLFKTVSDTPQDVKNKASTIDNQRAGERTLENISPEGKFTYFHNVYSELRQAETPTTLIVVTDGRFSDDWERVEHCLDWMNAYNNPPMHITFIVADGSEGEYDPSQPANMLDKIRKLNYPFINILKGTEVINMTPEEIAYNVLQPLSDYATLLQRTPILDQYGRETNQMVLGPDYEWNDTYRPWTGSYIQLGRSPDYKQ